MADDPSFMAQYAPTGVPLSDTINHVVGQTPTLLNRPNGGRFAVLIADKGGWRIRKGDYVSAGMPASEYPAASVTDGSGAVYMSSGATLVIPVDDLAGLTVRGYAPDSVLTYFWR